MLIIILNWIYILLTSFSLGFAFKGFVARKLSYELKGIDIVVFAGLVLDTIYAQVFSLFYKVGLVANVVLVFTSVVIFIVYRHKISDYVKAEYNNQSVVKKCVLLFLLLALSYCTSRGYIHYDSDLYHAQSIRWIEEYGVVKGLGNIHVRFAYNSSFFALEALYSMKFILGDSLHGVNGFFTFLLSVEIIKLIGIVKTWRINISDFARLGAFYYLTLIYGDIVSPATDYTIMCIIFYLVIKWLVLIENKEEGYVPYSLICVALVYAVTVKLTAGVILLLLIKPAYMLIKERRFGKIACFISMGALTILPWLARTVIISGYLIYPYPTIDIFNVDWKIPIQKVINDAAEIKTWGRGLYDANLVGLGIGEWFPNWFLTTLPATGKLFIVLDIICICIFAILVALTIRKRLKLWDELLVLAALIASYVFWQTQAPLLRYGYAYVILTIMVTFGLLWKNLIGKIHRNVVIFTKAVFAVIVVFFIIKAFSFVKYVYNSMDEPYYISQKAYGEYELETYNVNGVTFYYPIEGDRVGYNKFPAIPQKTKIVFRGGDMSEGFLPADE
jgi:hypothetical protein